jgi:pimeloyl-ACP methyl ester carboxylesterase
MGNRRSSPSSFVYLILAAAACGSGPRGPHIMADWGRPNGLFDAPFPSDDLGAAASAAAFPNPKQVSLVEQARALVGEDAGFSTTSGVYFQVTDPIDTTKLPSLADSVSDQSTVMLFRLDSNTGAVRIPIDVTFEAQASVYGAPNLLALVPLQGTPLLPGARYAALVTTDLTTDTGVPLETATDGDLGMGNGVISSIEAHGVDRGRIAGLAVFTVGDPTAGLARGRKAALLRPTPAPQATPVQTDLFADFCVYHALIDIPDFQQMGTSQAFETDGGTWQLDGGGAPVWQRNETSDLVITIPRTPVPTTGYPFVVFVRTGGGGDRPLVDRGQQATEGGPPIEPGEGPARYLARAGFAGIEVDGPLGGIRNPTNPPQDEEYLTFNVTNLGAMRDNIRESAIELDVMAHATVAMHLAATDCPPAGTTNPGPADVTFDGTHVAIMGHSMGAWIAPIAAAEEPMFKSMIIDGAGGSYIENIMWKTKPTPVYPVVSAIVKETDLKHDDPVLAISQWALEPSDPQVYANTFTSRAGNVLMVQGIVDDYILPDIANAMSLSLELQLGGTEYDTESDPRLAGERPLGPLLPLVQSGTITLPWAGADAGTRVVVQHKEDGIEDGHEVMFQTDAPKHQYQCFLESWLASGTPKVDVDAARDAPCP